MTAGVAGVAGFVVLAALTLLAAVVGAGLRHSPPAAGTLGWLDAWVRYDSGWYRQIAEHGYLYRPGEQSSVAFFPSYPLLMRAGALVTGDVLVAGVAVTVLSGLVAVLLFARWCSARMTREAALTAVAVLLLYPYAFYLYGAVYADALFLASTLGAFVLLEEGHAWLAGVVGALATAARPVGVAVLVGLAVRAVELAAERAGVSGGAADRRPGRGWRGVTALARPAVMTAARAVRCLRWRDAGVVLAGGGLAGYGAFLWVRFGSPLAFVAAESAPGWDQGFGPRTWFKVSFFGQLLKGDPVNSPRLVLPALVSLGMLLLLPRVRRRFGWGYAAFTALVVAIPVLGTKDFMGSGRYLLVAFPAFAVAAEMLTGARRPWLRPVSLAASGVLLLALAFVYGTGYEIS